jgi:hypothetical protein
VKILVNLLDMAQYLPLLREHLQVMENGKDSLQIHRLVHFWIMGERRINRRKHLLIF